MKQKVAFRHIMERDGIGTHITIRMHGATVVVCLPVAA